MDLKGMVEVELEIIKWIGAVKEDLKVARITKTDIYNRNTLRQEIFDWKVAQKEVAKSIGQRNRRIKQKKDKGRKNSQPIKILTYFA